jgi:hypothetical protein
VAFHAAVLRRVKLPDVKDANARATFHGGILQG